MPTYTWTIAPLDGVPCGYCGERVREGDAIELISREGLTRKLVRCELHAHTPIDSVAVDQARHALEAQRAAEAAAPELPSLSNARPTRVPLKRPVKAFEKISDAASAIFDPRAAQANDHD